MKKALTKITIILFIFGIVSCGEELSFKEGAGSDAVKGFLKAIQAGKKDRAAKYVLSSLREDATIKNFINSKLDSIDEMSEGQPGFEESVFFRNKLKEAKPELDDTKAAEMIKKNIKKIAQIIDDQVQKGVGKIALQKFFIVKLTQGGEQKSFVILFFPSHNVNHITGIVQLNQEIDIDAIQNKVIENL